MQATSFDGLAPISLAYSATGTWGGGLVIIGSAHDDTFSVISTAGSATTRLRTLGGNDTVRVSSDGTGVTGGLATLSGGLNIDLGSGVGTLAISDATESTPGANANVAVSPTALTGLAGPTDASTITLAAAGGSVAGFTLAGSNSPAVAEAYTVTDVPGPFTLASGGGNDTIALQGTSHPTTLQGSDGNDTFVLGSVAAGLGGIRRRSSSMAARARCPDPGHAADPSADLVALGPNSVSTEPGNSLFGAGGSLTHAGLEALTANLGSGSDSVSISATNAGTGNDGEHRCRRRHRDGAGCRRQSRRHSQSAGSGRRARVQHSDSRRQRGYDGDSLTISETGIGQGEGDTLFGPGGSLGYAGFTLVTLTLGGGADSVLLTGSPAGTLVTGAGDDTIELADGAALSGTVDAGDGNDTLSYASVQTPVTVDLDVGAAHGTSGVRSVENVTGGKAANDLSGLSGSRSKLIGGRGNDSLSAGAAADLLEG